MVLHSITAINERISFLDSPTAICGGIFAFIAIFTAFAGSISSALATSSSSVSNVSISIPVGCSISSTNRASSGEGWSVASSETSSGGFAGTMANGSYTDNAGTTTITVTCNDPNGWHVSAIGDGLYTGHRSYMYSTDGASYIPSNDAGSTMSGSGSNWAFKFASGTNSPAISTGYTNFKAIPDAYTKIISSNSDNPTTEQTFSVTYGVSIGDSQAAGTYTGEVKYILVAPEIEIDPDQVGILDWAGRSAGYKQVEYIESSGVEYIDTGLKITPTRVFVYDIKFASNSDRTLIGASANGGNYFGKNANNTYEIGPDASNWINLDATVRRECYFANTGTSTTLTVEGQSVSRYNLSIYDDTFGAIISSPTYGVMLGGATFYGIRVYDDDDLLRDFIPVVKDGVYGMWDNVTNTFYGNAGTGSFTGGPEV